MAEPFKLAIIGLDTSHAVEFPKLMQDPTIPEERKIPELKVTKALRFPSAFQPEAGQDTRQEYLESIGITVTRDFDEAVSDCDGILIEINDPSLHLEYFEKCATLGTPRSSSRSTRGRQQKQKSYCGTTHHSRAWRRIYEMHRPRNQRIDGLVSYPSDTCSHTPRELQMGGAR